MAWGHGRGFLHATAAQAAHPFDHHITIKKIRVEATGAASDVTITLDGVATALIIAADGDFVEIDFGQKGQTFNTLVTTGNTTVNVIVYHG